MTPCCPLPELSNLIRAVPVFACTSTPSITWRLTFPSRSLVRRHIAARFTCKRRVPYGRNCWPQYDCPDSSLPEPKRVVTTSPLQALTLLNSSFIVDMAETFAARITREAGADTEAQIRRAFALAFLRQPAPRELDGARELVAKHGLTALCRALFNATEFISVM